MSSLTMTQAMKFLATAKKWKNRESLNSMLKQLSPSQGYPPSVQTQLWRSPAIVILPYQTQQPSLRGMKTCCFSFGSYWLYWFKSSSINLQRLCSLGSTLEGLTSWVLIPKAKFRPFPPTCRQTAEGSLPTQPRQGPLSALGDWWPATFSQALRLLT